MNATLADPASDRSALDAAIREHDRITRDDIPIWLGAEPTFTDRNAQSPEWLNDALGDDKEERARALLRALAGRHPGAAILRPLGRQYTGEPRPRWCYGIYARRDGTPLWSGPPDLLHDGPAPAESGDIISRLRAALIDALGEQDWFADTVPTDEPSTVRLVARADGRPTETDARVDLRLGRTTVHEGPTPPEGLTDDLASHGDYLVLLHARDPDDGCNPVWVELPAFARVAEFATFLAALAHAASECGVSGLGLRGFPPPVDDTVAWTTLTPDPAVVEVNQAPQPGLEAFHRANTLLFELAAEVGLSSYRMQYNGVVSDSGGGGQVTFGGPSPARSPFFVAPQLLPRLIRYVIRHPSLSYWFATQYVGGSSQSPRADEGVRESFIELDVALEQLELAPELTPDLLWSTLRHFMVDASGNPHRSELNIEKLHNPFLPGRGRLGLVEFRALSMPRSPEIAAARALLLRSILVMLSRTDAVPRLWHWGDELHDKFALPYFLQQDLDEIFADLERAGLGLGASVTDRLRDKSDALLGEVAFEGLRLRLEQAVEFWPLVGDVASQESGTSRVVDASTSRIQLSLRAEGAAPEAFAAVRVSANGYAVPMCTDTTSSDAVRVLGLRYRSFVPWTGLHPTMPAENLIVLTLTHPSGSAIRVTLHPWKPDGGAYPGLPEDRRDAARRRDERVVVETTSAARLPPVRDPPARAVSPYCLDLRRLRVAHRAY